MGGKDLRAADGTIFYVGATLFSLLSIGNGKNKRKINDGDEGAMTGDDEEPARKRPHIEAERTYAHYAYEGNQWRQRGRDGGYFGV